jgi:hypothetical protein
MTVSENQYRITYRDNATGEEFVTVVPRASWLEQRNQLVKAGFDVVVQKRRVTTTAWTVVGEKAA